MCYLKIIDYDFSNVSEYKVKSKKADVGIGTLIIFIAMILVAAIAAGVLIQTATSLQNKALLTGSRSKAEVSTALTPILVFAEDGSNDSIRYFYMKVKLAPGSDPIKLGSSLLSFSLANTSVDLTLRPIDYSAGHTYNCTRNDILTDSAFNTINGEGNFSVNYLLTGPHHRQGYLHRGDVIVVCFEAPRYIMPDEDIRLTLVPKIGNPLVIETSIPDAGLTKRVYVFP